MKRLFILLSLCALWACATVAQNTNSVSGKCNGDVEWSFDGRTLFINNVAVKKGLVKMPDYDMNKNRAPWIKQKLAIRRVVIGAGIGNIGACAFAGCEDLTTVEFMNVFVWEISWGAFLNCRSLFNISIPVNVKRIGTIAFANCSSLRSITIPNLARVEDQAFLSCTNLNLIEIGENALLGKAVFATEYVEDGQPRHRCYKGEIRRLPRNINIENCEEYGLDKESVSVCLKMSNPYSMSERLSIVDTDIPKAAVVRNETYALVIGNERYRFVADVPFARNDAMIFAEYCKNTLGIPAENVHVCEDGTKHMILEQELTDWLGTEVTNRSSKRLIVYYAGHGVPDIKDHNKAYLLPTDVYGTKPHEGIALDKFYSILGNLGFERVTVFLDACFSGVNRDNDGLSLDRAVEVEAQETRPVTGNLIVLAATIGNETAQSFQEEGHGLFTYYLLKELQETQGMVTYGRLVDNVEKSVSNVAPTLDLRKKQTPRAFTSFPNDAWRKLSF